MPISAGSFSREGVESLLGGDVDTAKTILRDYIDATLGFINLAKATQTPSKSLMRMFGPAGNPRATNLLNGQSLFGAGKACDLRSRLRASDEWQSLTAAIAGGFLERGRINSLTVSKVRAHGRSSCISNRALDVFQSPLQRGAPVARQTVCGPWLVARPLRNALPACITDHRRGSISESGKRKVLVPRQRSVVDHVT